MALEGSKERLNAIEMSVGGNFPHTVPMEKLKLSKEIFFFSLITKIIVHIFFGYKLINLYY